MPPFKFQWPKLSLPKIKFPLTPSLSLPLHPAGGGKGRGLGWRLSFPVKKKNVLIIEITEEWLKMAGTVDDGGKRKIACLGAEPIKDMADLEISQKISQFLQAKNFKPAQVLISHPTSQLTTRILALPSTDPKEISDIIELQAVKQTPYTKEEITSGFHILDSDATGYSRVLLAISHRDVASRYFRVTELAKFLADQVTLSLEGIQSWFLADRSAEMSEAGRITLLLDVDWSATELLILKNTGEGGKGGTASPLLFSRSIGIGEKHIKEQGAPMQNEFLREVQRSLESGAPDLKGEKLTHAVLTGLGDSLKDLTALLSRELNIPCEILAQAPSLSLPLHPAGGGLGWGASPVSFASVLGLALHPEASKINLIPPEIKIRKGLEDRAKDLALLGTLLLALVTLLSAISFEKIYKKGSYLQVLKKDYGAIRKEAEEVERLAAKMRLAQEQMAAEGGFLNVLRDINEVIPDNIILTSLQFSDSDKNVTLRGLSEEQSAVFQFLSILEAAPNLEQVRTRSVTKKKVDDKDKAEFEIAALVGRSPGTAAEPVP